MTENLLKISLAVHLSAEKMTHKGKRDIKSPDAVSSYF